MKSDDQEKAIKKLDAELAKKTSDLNTFIFELTGRIKAVEDENATDVDVGASKETKELEGAIKQAQMQESKKPLIVAEDNTKIDLNKSLGQSVHTQDQIVGEKFASQ